MKKIKMKNRFLGDGSPVFIVAEVGINHNGDIGLARECIAAAADAGADSVKFQNYRTEDFVSDRSLMFKYRSRGKEVVESQYEMFKRCELSRDQLALLKETCDAHGVIFHSTPTSPDGIGDLQSINCEILKNGSDYLTNLELVQTMGETSLITVLSTGMATLAEIDESVRAFRETGNQKLILLHCTSSYPTAPEEVNLARLSTLTAAFDLPVGFSDHTKGIIAAVGATFLGTCWVEKHFTLDHNLSGPDHWFSMDPKELGDLVSAVRAAERMIGSSHITPTESELTGIRNFRLSCVTVRDMAVGEVITEKDITFKRPGDGIPPAKGNFLKGLKLKQSLKKGDRYKMEYFFE